MIDLNEIYSKIKFSTILTTGRTGSDYLHACLDNVPGLLIFSGRFSYYKFCDNWKTNKFEETEPLKILELFIQKNHYLFTKDDIENKRINLDIENFKKNFINICKSEKLTKQKFLLAMYLAYNLTIDRDIYYLMSKTNKPSLFFDGWGIFGKKMIQKIDHSSYETI